MPATATPMVRELPARERPVNRLREAGPTALSTTELLACLLQTGHALEQAQGLLVTLGGLDGLLRADEHALREVAGVGPSQAARLLAALELGRRAVAEEGDDHWQIRAPSDAGHILVPMIGRQERECFVVLFLDTRNRVIDQEVLYQGTINTSLVRTAEVFRAAVRRNCTSIIVAHNHPSGSVDPSPEDVALTRRLVEAGKLMEVAVLDHVIVGATRYRSMREAGLGW